MRLAFEQVECRETGESEAGETWWRGKWRPVQHVLRPVAPAAHCARHAECMEADADNAERGGQAQPEADEPAGLPPRARAALPSSPAAIGGTVTGSTIAGF